MIKKAFTLAEVLITLGIIGIVAVLVLPGIITDYNKKVASARLKKFYSTLAQATIRSTVDNGEVYEWTFPGGMSDSTVKVIDWYNTYYKPYMKGIDPVYVEDTDKSIFLGWNFSGDLKANALKLNFPDGTSALLYKGYCIDFIYDINAKRLPNKEGHDQFRFLVCPPLQGTGQYCLDGDKRPVCAYGTANIHNCATGGQSNDTVTMPCQGKTNLRDEAMAQCKRLPAACSALLEIDGWEFKSDYPYKL